MDLRIDRPILNKPTPEENIALLDRWMGETTDKLNMFIEVVSRKLKENDSNGSKD